MERGKLSTSQPFLALRALEVIIHFLVATWKARQPNGFEEDQFKNGGGFKRSSYILRWFSGVSVKRNYVLRCCVAGSNILRPSRDGDHGFARGTVEMTAELLLVSQTPSR